jgi:hypothetical protein
LSNRFDSFNDNGFYPHPDEVALRQELKEVSTLRKLAEQIRALDAHGVVLHKLGLQGLPEGRRNAALYALTLMLGYPTSTDQRTGRVAWDVKARPETGSDNRFVTFSERVGSADMHTDSSFYPMPEQQFILYVVNAAQCDGGHSILIDADDIYHGLHRTPEGAAAFALLSSTPVPFRVPAVYAAGDDQLEIHVAPVLSAGGRRRPVHHALALRLDQEGSGGAARHEQPGTGGSAGDHALRGRAGSRALHGAAADRYAAVGR